MPARVPLNGACDPWELALRMADEPRCVAFIGEWVGGGALLADRPARVAGGGDAFDIVDADRSGAWAGWWGYRAAEGAFDLACYEHVVVHESGRWWVERTTETGAVEAAVVERWQRRLESTAVAADFRVGGP
ncbi:MAG: hypothetical protein ACRDGQ_10160, partial [Candidatus Limnocylindrales bacterium]